MKTLLTTTALLALVTAGPALAQSDTAPATMDPPAATQEMAPDATAPVVTPDQSLTETETLAPAPTVAATGDVYIGAQATEEDLASNWIGKSLYNGADENLGTINDILIGTDGKVRGVIVGVGGFLGIGQKDVAVGFDAVETRTDADGNVELYINATQEQLEAAPEFKTLADLRAEDAANQPMPDPMAPDLAPAPVQ